MTGIYVSISLLAIIVIAQMLSIEELRKRIKILEDSK